jgi:hypothetical protein
LVEVVLDREEVDQERDRGIEGHAEGSAPDEPANHPGSHDSCEPERPRLEIPKSVCYDGEDSAKEKGDNAGDEGTATGKADRADRWIREDSEAGKDDQDSDDD